MGHKKIPKRNVTAKKKTYVGKIQGTAKGSAFFLRDGGDFFIPHSMLNGAQHGDTVEVVRLSGDQAEVVKILERGYTDITGTLVRYGREYYLEAENQSYFSPVRIVGDIIANEDDKIIVHIEGYSNRDIPFGYISKVIGERGTEEAEMLSTLLGYGFSDEFPEEVLNHTEWLYPLEVGDRLDLRDMLTVTIDGEDARDFDDAISIIKERNGYILWVHIADVSSYVIKGDPIDKEAYERATSVYFPKRAYPMLPEKLCNNLCSLREGEDKATVSVCMKYDFNGNMLSAKPYNTFIRSNHRLTYTKVQEMFDGVDYPEYADVKKMLFDGLELSKTLSRVRDEKGAIDFSASESKIIFADGKIANVEAVEQRESEKLIENFMISANEAVASMLERAGYPCAYRVHADPDPQDLKRLTMFASCFIDVPKNKYYGAEDIADLMRSCKGTPEGAIVSKVGIRCMQKAVYSPKNIGHYGLASESYCHFTSPIRRYPDLMVHRILKRYIAEKPYANLSKVEKDMEEWCEHCSERERSAERAERDALDYYKVVYISEHLDEEFVGMVSGVTANSFYVVLDSGIEGRVSLRDFDEGFYFDEMRYTLVAENRKIRLGDVVKIKVVGADILSRRVDFELVE